MKKDNAMKRKIIISGCVLSALGFGSYICYLFLAPEQPTTAPGGATGQPEVPPMTNKPPEAPQDTTDEPEVPKPMPMPAAPIIKKDLAEIEMNRDLDSSIGRLLWLTVFTKKNLVELIKKQAGFKSLTTSDISIDFELTKNMHGAPRHIFNDAKIIVRANPSSTTFTGEKDLSVTYKI